MATPAKSCPVPLALEGTPGAFRLLNVEVKYRADLANFFRYGGVEKLTQAKQRWADLYFIFGMFIEDNPSSTAWRFSAPTSR